MTYVSEKQASTTTLTHTQSSESRISHRSHRRRSGTRPLLVLHSISILFSLVSALVLIAAIPEWNANFFHSTGPIRGDWADGMPLIPLSFCIIFSTYNLFVLFIIPKFRDHSTSTSHKSVAGLPPSYGLSLSTMILLSLGPLLVIAGLDAIFRIWRPAIPSSAASTNLNTDGTPGSGGPQIGNPSTSNSGPTTKTIVCKLLNIFARECQPIIYQIGELQIAGIVCGSLAWLTWFGLWLNYCRTWQRERARAKRRKQRAERKRRAQKDGSSSRNQTTNRNESHGQHRQHRSKARHPNPRTNESNDDLASLIPKPLSTSSHLNRTLPSSRKNYYIPNISSSLQTRTTDSAATKSYPTVPQPVYTSRNRTHGSTGPVSRFNTAHRISARLSQLKDDARQHLPSSLHGQRYTRFDRENDVMAAQHRQPEQIHGSETGHGWGVGGSHALQAEVRRNVRPALTISQWLHEGKGRPRH